MISVENVVLQTDDGKPLLTNIDFALGRGDRVAFIGESGAGKTLLGRAIAGVLPLGIRMTHGRITGTRPSQEQVAQPSVTMVPQNPASAMPPLIRIRSLVRLASKWNGDGAPNGYTSDHYLDLAGFPQEDAARNSYPHELSGGMAQRATIAAALASLPDLLILDEPTASLDPIRAAALRDTLLLLNERFGLGLVIITHDIFFARSLCTGFIVLRNGRLVDRGNFIDLDRSPRDIYVRQLTQIAEKKAARTGESKTETPAKEEFALTLDRVCSGYGQGRARREAEKFILRDISLSLKIGDSLAIVGPSGSGKTTLGLVCAGFLPVYAGRAVCCGRRLVMRSITNFFAQKTPVQFVFQDPFAALNPQRTIGSWMRFARNGKGTANRTSMTIGEALDLVGLDRNIFSRLPSELSSGQCQRVVIAACLLAGARILILDEPTSMLDPIARETVIKALSHVRQHTDIAMLVLSHDFQFLREVCDTAIILWDGEIIEHGKLDEIAAQPSRAETALFFSALRSMSES